MNISKIMDLATAAIDTRLKAEWRHCVGHNAELNADIINASGNLVRGHGGTEAEIRAMRAEVRAWLLRGGETLN